MDQAMVFLEDRNKSYTFANIRHAPLARQFASLRQAPPNFGLTDSAWWARVQVRPLVVRSWLLRINNSRIDRADLYVVSENGTILHKTSGLRFPFMRRDVEDEDVIFRLPLPKGVLTTLYLRLESTDAMFLPVTLWTENDFNLYELREQFGMGLFYGLMIAMSLVNLLIFFIVRDRNNLYFALLLFSLSLVFMSMSGFSQILLPELSPWMAKRELPFFEGFAALWTFLFTRSFFNLHYS